jgi:hypothetical protein
MSESSSSSSTTTDRDASSSPAPESGPLGAEVDGYEEYMADDAKPPEYGAEGLTVLWESHDGEDTYMRSNVPVRDFE